MFVQLFLQSTVAIKRVKAVKFGSGVLHRLMVAPASAFFNQSLDFPCLYGEPLSQAGAGGYTELNLP